MKYQSSKGAALIVSLVMLTAVTFLAVVSLQRSTLQVRMVGNTQLKEQTFHTSMSELAAKYELWGLGASKTQALADSMTSVLVENDIAVLGDDDKPIYKAVDVDPDIQYYDNDMKVSTSITYVGSGSQIVNTLPGDSSVKRFIKHRFTINSTAAMSDAINSSQLLGVSYLASTGQ